ncbi:uncharacterized protein RHO25_004741 [Cercospora beticola]|uniref:Uncharacterized protein n=1 Tax=Cercospora beticola TaxID=122368 RepID=A0ABZ0NKR9_CERBT|nr:hypothetical protein RHO25_004741 [Cercospora beticola]
MGDWSEMERVLETRHPEMNMARVANAVALLSDWASKAKLRKKSEAPPARSNSEDFTSRRNTWSRSGIVQADDSVSLLDDDSLPSQPLGTAGMSPKRGEVIGAFDEEHARL